MTNDKNMEIVTADTANAVQATASVEVMAADVQVIAADGVVAKEAARDVVQLQTKNIPAKLRGNFYHPVKSAMKLVAIAIEAETDGVRVAGVMAGASDVTIDAGSSFAETVPDGLVLAAETYVTVVTENVSGDPVRARVDLIFVPLASGEVPTELPRGGPRNVGGASPQARPRVGGAPAGVPGRPRVGVAGGNNRRIVASPGAQNRGALQRSGTVRQGGVPAPEVDPAATAGPDGVIPPLAKYQPQGALTGNRRTIDPNLQRSTSLSPTVPVKRASPDDVPARTDSPSVVEGEIVVRLERFRMPALRDLVRKGAPLPPAHHGAVIRALRGGDEFPGEPFVMPQELADRVVHGLTRGGKVQETDRAAFGLALGMAEGIVAGGASNAAGGTP